MGHDAMVGVFTPKKLTNTVTQDSGLLWWFSEGQLTNIALVLTLPSTSSTSFFL